MERRKASKKKIRVIAKARVKNPSIDDLFDQNKTSKLSKKQINILLKGLMEDYDREEDENFEKEVANLLKDIHTPTTHTPTPKRRHLQTGRSPFTIDAHKAMELFEKYGKAREAKGKAKESKLPISKQIHFKFPDGVRISVETYDNASIVLGES